ncbi:Mismatch repair protein msh3 [Microbotryomycetes sp. JL201]|nr:Mismatch repair protein msh3 [Microbotryomycetes sp. JL201]
MTRDDSDAKQSTLSSYFNSPAPTSKHKALDVLVIDDSEDESESTIHQPPVKRVKTAHESVESDARGASTVSTFFKLAPAPAAALGRPGGSTLSASTAKGPSRARDKVERWKYRAQTVHQTLSDNTTLSPTPAVLARREAFATKLLGRDLLQRGNAYLQEEHYMAAARKEQGDSDMVDEARDSAEEQSEDRSAATRRKQNDDDTPSATGSKFAKYAARTSAHAKGKAKAREPEPAGPKYTPFEKQVIALKEENPGVVLAVEVGYKYRFYEEDAKIASRVLSIAHFMKNNMLTAGIPTHRLTVHIKRLLNAGYTVGVVRQKETAALKKISSNRSKPFTRAVDALYTPATYIEEAGIEPLAPSSSSTPTVMCIVEGQAGRDGRMPIGLIAVVPGTGEVIHDSFEDSLMRSELETRILHMQPSELLLPDTLSRESKSISKYLAGQHDAGSPGASCRFDYFKKQSTQEEAQSFLSEALSRALRGSKAEMVLDDSDDESVQKEAEMERDAPFRILDLPELSLIALAATVRHLARFGLDKMVLHSSSFHHFSSRTSMCLNGNTLANLEVLVNSTDFAPTASLFQVLDHCKTPFGRRKLRKWITRPLLSRSAVNERLDAVTEILKNASPSMLVLSKLRNALTGLPDLERGLVRIHLGRATPIELARVLETFERIANVFQDVSDCRTGLETASSVLKSSLLRSLVARLPQIKPEVTRLLSMINVHRARDGKKDEMFRETPDDIQDCRDCLDAVEVEMTELLSGYRKLLKKPALKYVEVAEEEYLLEVRIPESKNVPADWIKVNSTRAVYRFRPPQVEEKYKEIKQNRERLAAAAHVAYLKYLERVSEHYELFRAIVSELATADVLFSFAKTAASPGYTRPVISDVPGYIEIVEGRHPIVEVTSPNPFVPNSIRLGGKGHKQMILTGLNMGGKSSFSRSVALIALMSQVGCYVPADSCTTSLFDAILTRMGASDEIARGRSTFMVEMSETSEILKMASPRSLVILDELGRGTSTNDGQAIASAVLEHMVKELRATTIFVTHYPAIVEISKRFPRLVSVNHMSCFENTRSTGFVDVTFLYKVVPGLASKSHGLNVARMAELPESVLDTALVKSEELEKQSNERTARRRARKMIDLVGLLQKCGDHDATQLLEACRNLALSS